MGILISRGGLVALLAFFCASSIAGCSTRLDRHWGESHRGVIALQAADSNPEASTATEVDGVTAGKAVESLRGEVKLNTVPPSIIESGS